MSELTNEQKAAIAEQVAMLRVAVPGFDDGKYTDMAYTMLGIQRVVTADAIAKGLVVVEDGAAARARKIADAQKKEQEAAAARAKQEHSYNAFMASKKANDLVSAMARIRKNAAELESAFNDDPKRAQDGARIRWDDTAGTYRLVTIVAAKGGNRIAGPRESHDYGAWAKQDSTHGALMYRARVATDNGTRWIVGIIMEDGLVHLGKTLISKDDKPHTTNMDATITMPVLRGTTRGALTQDGTSHTFAPNEALAQGLKNYGKKDRTSFGVNQSMWQVGRHNADGSVTWMNGDAWITLHTESAKDEVAAK